MIKTQGKQLEIKVEIKSNNNKTNNIGVITLNRPKALNSLSFDMIKDITSALLKFKDDDNISAVIIKGNGERAFCAGGDIKSLFKNGKDNPKACMDFFYNEYRLNTLIKNYPKPYIALLHGVTMGGGVGISNHASHRIAANSLVFAMPESNIGFFTDIGASFFLPRCTDYAGIYLGLTGNTINYVEAKYLNLSDHIIETTNHNKSFDEIINKIVNIEYKVHQNYINNITNNVEYSEQISNILSSYDSLDNNIENKNNIKHNIRHIKECFNASSVQEILTNLENLNNEWSQATLKILKSKSPTSLLIIFELLKRGKELNFKQCMQMEFNVAYGFLINHDFYEGIRAALIDKDNKPNWNKIDLANTKNFDYETYFNSRDSYELDFIGS